MVSPPPATGNRPLAERSAEVVAGPSKAPAVDPGAAAQSSEPVNPLRGPIKAPEVRPVPEKVSAVEGPPAKASAAEPPSAAPPAGSGKPRPGKRNGIPFDPIKENRLVFVGWPKPKAALLITGRQDGYMEPCGCAGLDSMKGGMSRRHTLFQTLRRQGWPVVGLDVGAISKGFGRQAELKFQTMVEGMLQMRYDAIALGAGDLQLPAGVLVAAAAGADAQQSPFVSADVVLPAGLPAKTRLVEAGGVKFGITAVLGKEFRSQVHNDEIQMADPAAALAAVVPELKQKAGYLILLAHATPEESDALAKQFPDFDLVVTAGGAAEPPDNWAPIAGSKAKRIEVGEKGENAVVLGMFDDPAQPLRYQRVPLDSRFDTADPLHYQRPPADSRFVASPEMKLLMTFYQDQLKALGFAELTPRPAPHPQRETNGNFVGSAKCKDCHEESYKVWKKSRHAKAYETLAKLDPPRNFDPECISCHVIGWHPTSYFPYQGGYESFEKTPQLIDVGCDSCHGPGEAHVLAEMGADVALQKKMQQAVVITKAESEKQQCSTCHDLDNSPDFDFPTYWPDVEHHEKE
jgi:hypothetical protein